MYFIYPCYFNYFTHGNNRIKSGICLDMHKALSILKPGSYTRRGSNTCQVVQQNEWSKRLGPFKRRVPKLLNVINIKIMPYIKEKLILHTSCTSSFWMLLLLIIYSLFVKFIVFPLDALIWYYQWMESTHFVNVLACNHGIEFKSVLLAPAILPWRDEQ